MKITLCGSTRFKKEYQDLNALLTKAGHIVYSVAVMEKSDGPLTETEKRRLDLVHLKKILESDAIVIVGAREDGTCYIGDSTRREIEWASLNNKTIYCGIGRELYDLTGNNGVFQVWPDRLVDNLMPDQPRPAA